MSGSADIVSEIRALKTAKRAVILAHNYELPDVQDLADFVGDSLSLSRKAAETNAELIIFCGVHFMAETASILSPQKKVLLPDLDAGCSLAATITAEELRTWKDAHPDAVVVSYVNTSAEVKAETDYCCTSSNAVKVVEAIPADREILFLPDMFLGAYVKKITGRTNMRIWAGECHVHAGIRVADMKDVFAQHPGAEFLIHPECGCASATMLFAQENPEAFRNAKLLSTEGMVNYARTAPAKEFLVATEVGILHRMEKLNPDKKFYPVNRKALCRFMKMITPAKVLRALRDEVHEVRVPAGIAARARKAIDRMVAIG